MNIKKVSNAPLIATLLLSLAGHASASAIDDLVQTLITKGILTEAEGALLLQRRENAPLGISESVIPQQTARVEVGKKGLVVKSHDDSYSMAVGGRLHAEMMSHSNDQDLTKSATDGTDIRRARIYLKGRANTDWKYAIEADLAGNKVSMKDVFLVYTGIENWDFTVGAQKHAMSMEVQESSNDIMFTERGMTVALSTPYFDRALGINAKRYARNWNIQAGLYGDQFSPESSGDNDEGYGIAARGSWALINQKDRVFHIGASYGTRSTDNDNATNGKSDFKYETTNGSNLKLLDTPSIDGLDKITINSLELAAMRGRFSFQSEFTQASAQRDMAADLDFSAWYLQAGYTLTGESRSYKGSDGEFKRLKPATEFSLEKGTWGAWEVAARLDHLDLDDGPATSGGSGDRYTLALNWYLNYNVRVMADYSRVYNLDNGPVTRLNGGDADNIDTFTLRTQWAF